jgi:uncharacterized coiled-coil protein SlyX
MSEKTAAVDQLKGATLEEISAMVEQIGREFKSKQLQLQPLMQELKSLRQDYMELDSRYQEAKNTYDKVAITLDLDKQALEKECDAFQEECLREESRYHTLNSLVSIAKIRLQRAEQEKKWNDGNGRMLRDFASFKELYTVSCPLLPLLSLSLCDLCALSMERVSIKLLNKSSSRSSCANSRRSSRRMLSLWPIRNLTSWYSPPSPPPSHLFTYL